MKSVTKIKINQMIIDLLIGVIILTVCVLGAYFIIERLHKMEAKAMACLKDKLPEPVQGEPALYDEGHIHGELWAFKQTLHKINESLDQLKHEGDVDEVACEVSYEMEPGEDTLSVRVRQGIFDHIKKELLTWPNRDLNLEIRERAAGSSKVYV